MMKQVTVLLTTIGLAGCIVADVRAQAPFNYVSNGTFTQYSGGVAAGTSSSGQLGVTPGGTGSTPFLVTDWTNGDYKTTPTVVLGYNFLYSTPTQATVTGAPIKLYPGTVTGSPAVLTASPAGGGFLADDGAYEQAAVTQPITGLTVGQTYVLTFYWAGAQQTGYSGNTTDNWTATLGSQSDTTGTISLLSNAFSGWQSASFAYTPTATNETLSFLAAGTPNGEPPFALLSGVSLYATPEPSSVVAMLIGMLGLVSLVRFRIGSMKSKV